VRTSTAVPKAPIVGAGGYFHLLQAFATASRWTQSQILHHLYAPSLEEIESHCSTGAAARRHAQLEQQRILFLQQFPQHKEILTQANTQRLLAIVACNAYQLFNYQASHQDDAMEHSWMGLFLLSGSMVEHSCNPNMTLNTTRDGRVELIAETHIQPGDYLSFSYIEGIYEKDRAQRQAQLLAEKHFVCACARCQSVDECRPLLLLGSSILPSTACNNEDNNILHPVLHHALHKEYVSGRRTDVLSSPEHCAPISVQQDELEQAIAVERDLVQQIQSLEEQFDQGTADISELLRRLCTIMTGDSWNNSIHPSHFLTVKAHQLLSTTVAAMARLQEQQSISSNNSNTAGLLRLSVVALLHNIVWVERSVSRLRRRPRVDDSDNTTANDVYDDISSPAALAKMIQTNLASGSYNIPQQDLERIIRNGICRPTPTPGAVVETTAADVLLTIFYAGQDLLYSGNTQLCLLLYQRYQPWFHKLKQPSDDNRHRIDVFVSSNGRTNPFEEMLL
jgi:hypothetical protein